MKEGKVLLPPREKSSETNKSLEKKSKFERIELQEVSDQIPINTTSKNPKISHAFEFKVNI